MKDFILAGAKRLTPPRADASDGEIRAWRWFVAIVVGATAMSLAAHIALACGFFPAVYSGFALASDVDKIQLARKLERETALETSILQAREKQCTAASGEVRYLYTGSLQKMLVEYQKLTNTQYPLPECTSFR